MQHGDWVNRYLQRIGLEGEPGRDLAGLTRLHRAHILTVPFENLNIPLGYPVETAGDALFEKVVVRRRGGFCYELNHLFALLLQKLGFSVDLLCAGVWTRERFGPPFDHLLLAVHLAGFRGCTARLPGAGSATEDLTLFEKKYRLSGHPLWTFRARLNAAPLPRGFPGLP